MLALPRRTPTSWIVLLWGLIGLPSCSAPDRSQILADLEVEPSVEVEPAREGREDRPTGPEPSLPKPSAPLSTFRVPTPMAPELNVPVVACASASAEVVQTKQPIDIVLVLDNSGSMADELDAVERNINVNFTEVIEESGVDYRVILLSRHRRADRNDSEEASTSICVQQPLSGLAECPADKPVLSSRFFQYSIKIESDDSFSRILETFNRPETRFDATDVGWSEWLRPSARKVFLEFTDDNASMPVDEFVQELVDMAPEHFGSDPEQPQFVFHSIVGARENTPELAVYSPEDPVQLELCEGNGNKVENAGVSYQELSRLTGGLRFPLCQFQDYDVVFRTIAENVVTLSGDPCVFEIPDPPEGKELDLGKVGISFSGGEGEPEVGLGQAANEQECQAEAFYIQGDSVHLCPESCREVKGLAEVQVEVSFQCESTLILR